MKILKHIALVSLVGFLSLQQNACFIEGCAPSQSGKVWADAMSDEERVRLFARWLSTLDKDHVVYDFSCVGRVTIYSYSTKLYSAIDSYKNVSNTPVWGNISGPMQLTADSLAALHLMISSMKDMDLNAEFLATEKFMDYITSPASTWQNALGPDDELVLGKITCKQNYRGNPPSNIGQCKKAENYSSSSGEIIDTNIPPPSCDPTIEQNCDGF